MSLSVDLPKLKSDHLTALGEVFVTMLSDRSSTLLISTIENNSLVIWCRAFNIFTKNLPLAFNVSDTQLKANKRNQLKNLHMVLKSDNIMINKDWKWKLEN